MHSSFFKFLLPAIGLLLLALLLGCGVLAPTPEATATWTPLPPQTRVVRVTATPSVTPTPSPAPTATPTPAPLTASAIFDLISGSVAYLETSLASGSGFLIEGNYLVTNAHVVWPFDRIRVVFQDGTEFEDVPVVDWDLMADLAVIGPIETDLTPLELVDGEDQIIGADVYLIGYPGEVDEFPKATITRGLISRMRESELLDVSFFQSDALVAGGQSGGVLVSEKGDVIGVSGFKFTEAGFALVASAIDLRPRVEGLIAGQDVDGLGSRAVPLEGGELHQYTSLSTEWDEAVYVLYEPEGTEFEVELQGEADGGFLLVDPYGYSELYADDNYRGGEEGSIDLPAEAPYFLRVFQKQRATGVYQLTTSHPVALLEEKDDGRGLRWGNTVLGSIDYPGDVDYYEFSLRAGDVVNIRVESTMIDPVVEVGGSVFSVDQYVWDDDSGGGLFGTDAELTYQVLNSTPFYVTVYDAYDGWVGGYAITVDAPDEDSPTPMAPEPTAAAVSSEFGPMALHESSQSTFSIRYPASWTDKVDNELMSAVSSLGGSTYQGEDAVLILAEEDLDAYGLRNMELSDYVDLTLSLIDQEWVSVVSREDRVTAQGEPAEYVIMEMDVLSVQLVQFNTLHEGRAFRATFMFFDADDEAMRLANYVFDSFRVLD